MATSSRKRRSRKKPMDFTKRLVLNQYLLSLFGHETLEGLVERWLVSRYAHHP